MLLMGESRGHRELQRGAHQQQRVARRDVFEHGRRQVGGGRREELAAERAVERVRAELAHLRELRKPVADGMGEEAEDADGMAGARPCEACVGRETM